MTTQLKSALLNNASVSADEPTVEQWLTLFRDSVPRELFSGWERHRPIWEAHRRMAREHLKSIPAYPERYHGRGIVICAGGAAYFVSAYVAAKMLRHVGCALPIQFWHLTDEIDDHMRSLVAPLGVSCIDAGEIDRRRDRPCRILNGWELKCFAILFCPYQHVLLLDADNVPVIDPSDLLDSPEFDQYGAIFWPDYGRIRGESPIWEICEVPFRDEPEFESGQIAVDKRRCWNALNLAQHYNDHSDFYYRHVYGDKETFHLAFLRTDTPFAMPTAPIHTLRSTMCQHDFAGRRLFQHRVGDKWRLDGANRRVDDFWFEDLCRYFIEELVASWSGQPFWSRPCREHQALVVGDSDQQDYWYERVGYDRRILELRRDGTIGEGAAAYERLWSMNTVHGQSVLTILGDGSTTCHLRRENGLWSGRWRKHEQMAVRLMRVS